MREVWKGRWSQTEGSEWMKDWGAKSSSPKCPSSDLESWGDKILIADTPKPFLTKICFECISVPCCGEMKIILLKAGGGQVKNYSGANGLEGFFLSDNCIYAKDTPANTHESVCMYTHICSHPLTHTSCQTHTPFKAVKCSLIGVAGRHPE